MSKPREFWVDVELSTLPSDKIKEFLGETIDWSESVQIYNKEPEFEREHTCVIEKSAADKLAEALELIRKHGCDDSHAWLNAEQALKEYRGEK